MEKRIRVAVCGAAGKMGREVVKAVLADDELDLCGACDRAEQGRDAGEVAGAGTAGVTIIPSLADMLAASQPDVVVDFTHPSVVFDNVMAILPHAHAVVGTTGLGTSDLEAIAKRADEQGRAAIVCPNFAIGAVLMMHCAGIVARYLPDVEIVELHHERKADAPSGTALKTAEIVARARTSLPREVASEEHVPGARGARYEDVPIHSVRLPGLVAHQEVLFGGPGQLLTIRHDSFDRTSFMPGVLLAIKKAPELTGLVYGLEHLLGLS
jgi:4-hydroxy-tetrahydrodipicolinate reductase